MEEFEKITLIFSDMTPDARVSLYENLHREIGLTSKKLVFADQIAACLTWGEKNGVEFLLLSQNPEYGLPIYGLRTDPLTLLKLL